VDDLGNSKISKPNQINLVVQSVKPDYEVLPGRVNTCTPELDRLLMGGIPEGYAVALATPSTDERQIIINRFLEAGLKSNKTTVYITCETSNAHDIATKYQQSYLVLCSPQADLFMQSLPNVCKLKGIENLTDIDIALTKLFKTLPTSTEAPKRVCIDLISDVLLQHHAVITRKWLSSLLANLKAKGFTTLAIVDPSMHLPEETQAVLSLFDGEARITHKETTNGNVKTVKVTKLQGQKYLKDETILA